MSIIKKMLVFFVFLFLISHVYAQDYDLFSGKFYDLKEGQEKIEFEFYNDSYNVCENEQKTIPILVVNKDAIDNKYSLEAVGASWISLNVKEFSLPKRQSGVIFLNLNPAQNSKGKYNVKIFGLSSVGNVRKELSIDVNVEKCYSVNLNLEKEEDKVCGGVKKQYSGEIINDGKEKIDVELIATGPNWVNANKNEFSIDSNNKQKFELNADVPANAKGIFNVIVNAIVKNFPAIKSERKLSIEVVPKYDCYKADIITDAKITNDYSNSFAPIKIRNSGVKQAIYEVTIEAPSWISVEPKQITINSEQIGNLNLNINPDVEIAEGNYQIKINVKYEDIVYSKNIDVVLSKKQFLKGFKSFFVFYQYYIYVLLLIAAILFIFRRQISNKIKTKYKNYKIRQARLKALEAARKARQLKRQLKEIETKKPELKIKRQKLKKFELRWFFIALIVVASLLFLSIQQFDFPVTKQFVKNYYAYFIVGFLISLFVIFLFEFYKPLFGILKNLNKKKRR